jgi:hypothetical protein
MNELTALREAAPLTAPLTPTVRLAARAALMEEIAGHSLTGQVRRPARRRVWFRAGVGLIAAAAAWTTAVVVTATDPSTSPASSVDLVSFAPPTFPFTLNPAPVGLQVSYSADPGGYLHAIWSSTTSDDRLAVNVSPVEPDLQNPTESDDVAIQGRDGQLATQNITVGTEDGSEVRPQEVLVLEWTDDQWVSLSGDGQFDDRNKLINAAEGLTAAPVNVGLSVGLAPAGWSIQAYKDDDILTLANDDAPQQTLTVSLPEEPIASDELLDQIMGPTGPVIELIVNNRPAQLVPVDTEYTGPGGGTGWYLQAQLLDGRTFTVQAPSAFTQQQVLDLAQQVTIAP